MSSGEGYVPDQGHLIWTDLSPQVGREQSGRRPAVVLTDYKYNRLTSLCVLCPITNRIRGYPFEVILPASAPAQGVVLCDHIKSSSWLGRGAKYIGELDPATLNTIRGKVKSLLRLP